MIYNYESKVVLITGAASGIGLETERLFAKAGAAVTMADLNFGAVSTAAESLIQDGFKALAIHCDVTNEEQVALMVQNTVSIFGRLDFAYNNAGMHVPVAETADALSTDFDKAIAINLKGIWLCMKYELQQMRKQESCIVTILIQTPEQYLDS